jgi:hypothetical protein
MSWNEMFWWLAILALSLAVAQFGIPNLTPSFWKRIFRWMSSAQIRETMRVSQNFLAILSVIALLLALVAGIELIVGFGSGLAILIAKHFGYSNNAGLIEITQIALCLAIAAIVAFVIRYFWRVAATLPNRGKDIQEDTGTINAEIREHFKKIRGENSKSKGEGRNKQ